MSGVAIIRYLLSNNLNLISQVPADRIMAGNLPKDISYPAISIKKISGAQENNLAMNSASYLVEQRIQVSVITKSYPEIEPILALVLKACPLSKGDVNGTACEGILPDTEGPDLSNDQLKIFQQSQDFMVSFIRSTT